MYGLNIERVRVSDLIFSLFTIYMPTFSGNAKISGKAKEGHHAQYHETSVCRRKVHFRFVCKQKLTNRIVAPFKHANVNGRLRRITRNAREVVTIAIVFSAKNRSHGMQ